ncbi:MAG: hypothetical protein WC356_06930 [Candidatus Micrarchaeia archaeon]|jgi:hypothetical protein
MKNKSILLIGILIFGLFLFGCINPENKNNYMVQNTELNVNKISPINSLNIDSISCSWIGNKISCSGDIVSSLEENQYIENLGIEMSCYTVGEGCVIGSSEKKNFGKTTGKQIIPFNLKCDLSNELINLLNLNKEKIYVELEISQMTEGKVQIVGEDSVCSKYSLN